MAKFVPCTKCGETGWVLLKKNRGAYSPCGACHGCGGITYVSPEQLNEIAAGRLSSWDLEIKRG